MPNLRDIRKRIESVRNTGKITKAMQMVSASKLRKAQSTMLLARPYSDRLYKLLTTLADGVEKENYPLLQVRPRGNVKLMVLSSDKGLCGAFNSNVLKETQRLIHTLHKEGAGVSIISVGKKGRDYFKRYGIPVQETLTDFYRNLTYDDVKRIAAEVMQSYTDERIDELIIVYNEFKNVLIQSVRRLRLLPIVADEMNAADIKAKDLQAETQKDDKMKDGETGRFLCEPSEDEIMRALLPKYVENQLYRAFLDSKVSEEAARMVAMENATKNTRDLIDQLTLQFNKARQASITGELMDIVGGANAIAS